MDEQILSVCVGVEFRVWLCKRYGGILNSTLQILFEMDLEFECLVSRLFLKMQESGFLLTKEFD
jgi:hypothetical protein